MHWAKTRAKVKYDLALSGILNLPFGELGAAIEDIDINGDNSYGYAPLVNALAAHAKVAPDRVVTISGGTSMANHLAMAAAIEHGDCVAITNASTQSCGKRRQKSNPRTLVLYAASQLRATIVRDHRNADVTRHE